MPVCDPKEHRSLATRFAGARVLALAYRSFAQWLLGYPDAALADAERAVPPRYAPSINRLT
jgi:hypothetical protein